MTREQLRDLARKQGAQENYTLWLESILILALRYVQITPGMLEAARAVSARHK